MSSHGSALKRLAIWYTIITALFRCPANLADITASTPRVCLPYLHARDYAAPYVRPHYDAHLAPWVDKAWPYYQHLDDYLLTPVSHHGQYLYQQHGAPRLQTLHQYGMERWNAAGKPQVDRVQAKIRAQYDEKLASHIDFAGQIVQPYIKLTQRSAVLLQDRVVLPAYHSAVPYAKAGVILAHTTATDTLWPLTCSAWASTVDTFDRTLWPKVRLLYGENVEPQLVRIRERLGRYRDSRRVKAVVGETPAPDTREQIEADLKSWQSRFDKAAQTGMADLTARSAEIITSQTTQQIQNTAQALLVELEKSVSQKDRQQAESTLHAIHKWRTSFEQELSSLLDAATSSTLDVFDEICKIGMQEIGSKWAKLEGVEFKDWSRYNTVRKSFDDWHQKVEQLSTDIPGLQQTRDKANEVVSQAENLVQTLTDQQEFASEENADTESEQNADTKSEQNADAGSEENSAEAQGSIIGAIAQKVPAQKPILDEPISSVDPMAIFSDATSRAQAHYSRAISRVSDMYAGSTPKPVHQDMTVSLASAYTAALAAASSRLAVATGHPIFAHIDNRYSAALSVASDQFEAAKTALGATSTPGYEKLLSEVSATYASMTAAAGSKHAAATEAVSEAIYGTSTGALASVSAMASSRLSIGISQASAQLAYLRGATPTPSLLQEGQRRYYEAIGQAHEQYSEFVASASSVVYGTPTPVYQSLVSAVVSNGELASSKLAAAVEQASSSASSVVYGEEPGWSEKASENWEALVSKASVQVYGTPTPFHVSAFAMAQAAGEYVSSRVEKVTEVGEWASQATETVGEYAAEQYQAVQAIISELVVGREPTVSESVMSRLSAAWPVATKGASEAVQSVVSKVASATDRVKEEL